VEDFYDLFLEQAKKLRTVDPSNSSYFLDNLLCNNQEATYLIMYARFMTACHLKQNAIMFEGFVGDVAQFCLTEVEQVDVECDHP